MQNTNENSTNQAATNVVDSFFGADDFNASAPLDAPNKAKKFKNHRKNLQKQNAAAKAKVAAEQAREQLKSNNTQNFTTEEKNPQNQPNFNNATKQNSQNFQKDKNKKRSKKSTHTIKLSGNEDWQKAMQASIKANKQMHDERLHPLKNANDASVKVRITPLGGLGEIGANMTVFETDNDAIIVDVGMSFPDENMPGVDILVPDFSYIRKIKDKVRAVLITHAHEDHIGAMPYFFKEFQFPIYATPLPLGMISNKFEEHGLKAHRSYFRPIQKRKIYEIGEFEVEFIHITHSVIDASALAIKTKAGVIIHTGDFKLDPTPIDGYATDLHRLAHYGEEGVLLLMSDSTNSWRDGVTKSENSVGKTFDELFDKAKGRVIMSTFSSNIHRVFQAIERGIKHGRKVCVIGRSMERNLFTAIELGYISLKKEIFIDANEVAKYKDNEILIVTTGSQGETMSALYRMATDEHKYIKIKPSDQIIISAKAIPGNEASVSAVLNYLLKNGASVAYQDFSEIHVSGHAASEEQKMMLNLIKPKFFLPVHGEYNHILRHKEHAIACGVDERNIYLMNDGDQMELTQRYLKRARTVKTGKTFIDNQIGKQISDDVVIDRQQLSEAGIIVIMAQIDRNAKRLIKNRVITHGLIGERANTSKELQGVIEQFLSNVRDDLLNDTKALENQIRQVVRKHIFRKIKKYPTIVPIIYLM